LERSEGTSARCYHPLSVSKRHERGNERGEETYVEPPDSNTGRRQFGYPDTAAVGGELGAVGGGGEVLDTAACEMKCGEVGGIGERNVSGGEERERKGGGYRGCQRRWCRRRGLSLGNTRQHAFEEKERGQKERTSGKRKKTHRCCSQYSSRSRYSQRGHSRR
jgi:hypothetical protein